MSNKSKKKSSLIEIRDILKGELDKFTAINSEVINNQNDFEKIHENYEKYDVSIDESRNHITKLKKREFYENLFVWIGFFFFMLCVLYVWLRRFPIHKIFLFFLKLGRKTINLFLRLFNLSSSKNIKNKQLNKNEL